MINFQIIYLVQCFIASMMATNYGNGNEAGSPFSRAFDFWSALEKNANAVGKNISPSPKQRNTLPFQTPSKTNVEITSPSTSQRPLPVPKVKRKSRPLPVPKVEKKSRPLPVPKVKKKSRPLPVPKVKKKRRPLPVPTFKREIHSSPLSKATEIDPRPETTLQALKLPSVKRETIQRPRQRKIRAAEKRKKALLAFVQALSHTPILVRIALTNFEAADAPLTKSIIASIRSEDFKTTHPHYSNWLKHCKSKNFGDVGKAFMNDWMEEIHRYIPQLDKLKNIFTITTGTNAKETILAIESLDSFKHEVYHGFKNCNQLDNSSLQTLIVSVKSNSGKSAIPKIIPGTALGCKDEKFMLELCSIVIQSGQARFDIFHKDDRGNWDVLDPDAAANKSKCFSTNEYRWEN